MIICKLSEPVKYVSEGHQTGYWDVVRAEQFIGRAEAFRQAPTFHATLVDISFYGLRINVRGVPTGCALSPTMTEITCLHKKNELSTITNR